MLQRNEVLNWREEDFRVLHWDGRQVFVYPLKSELNSYKVYDYLELSQAKAKGEAKSAPDPYVELRLSQPKGKVRERADKNYQLILPIVSDPSKLFSAHRREEMLKLVDGDINKLSKVYRLIRLWWLKGQVPNALIPGFGHNKGQRDTAKKVGCKCSATSKVPPVNQELRKEFARACSKYLLKPDHLTVPQAYLAFLADYRSAHPGTPDDEMPTRRQFSYFWETNYTRAEKNRRRNSPIVYDKDIKSLTGNVYDTVDYPGALYEVDSTLADLNLVSEDRRHLIGRPTLYIVTDRFSGMITGFSVSFHPPQFLTAADAVYCAIRDKREVAEELGIKDFKPEDWPCAGLPRELAADNAELATASPELFAKAFGVTLSNTPSYRGDCKGTVEDGLGEIQHFIKGCEPPGIPDKIKLKKAGGKDKRLEACLTLSDYRKLVFRAIIYRNQHLRISVPAGFPADIPPTPQKIWNWYSDMGFNATGHVRDPDAVRLALLIRRPATISRDGVQALGIRYQCKDVREQGFLDKVCESARPTGLELVFDPADISRAWVSCDPANPLAVNECVLAPMSKHLSGKTLEEACAYIAAASKTASAYQRDLDALGSRTVSQCQEVIEAAKDQASSDGGSAASRIKNIPANRKEAKALDESAHPRISPREPEPSEKAPPEVKKKRVDFSYPEDDD